ncbi:MAG: GNAT family N-acetyltransferase [Dermatophilaceae bacterium]
MTCRAGDQVTVRPAGPADVPDLVEAYLSSRRTFLLYAPLVHPDDAVAAWVAGPLLDGGGLFAVCRNGSVVGMLATSDDGAVRWIDHLYLRPGETGRGTGAVALTSALVTLRPPVRLFTFQRNVGARRFYERHGFVPVRFGDGSDNEERCPDVLYEWRARDGDAADHSCATTGR